MSDNYPCGMPAGHMQTCEMSCGAFGQVWETDFWWEFGESNPIDETILNCPKCGKECDD